MLVFPPWFSVTVSQDIVKTLTSLSRFSTPDARKSENGTAKGNTPQSVGSAGAERIERFAVEQDVPLDEVRGMVKEMFGVSHLFALTEAQARALMARIEQEGPHQKA